MPPTPFKPKLRLVSSRHDLAQNSPAERYLATLSQSGARSMRSRLHTVARLCKLDYAAIDWTAITHRSVDDLRTMLLASELSPASINTMLCAMRGIAKQAWRDGHLTAEDYQKIKDVPAVRGSRVLAGRALQWDELTRLFQACAEDRTAAGARDAAAIALLVGLGLRRTECVNLMVKDYAQNPPRLRIVGKGNKERIVYLEDNVHQAISDWLAIRGHAPGRLLVPVRKNGKPINRPMRDEAIYALLRKRALAAGLDHCSPHDLRRTWASDMLDAGADISALQQLAGWSSVTTAQRYDRRGERAKIKAAQLYKVPYRKRG